MSGLTQAGQHLVDVGPVGATTSGRNLADDHCGTNFPLSEVIGRGHLGMGEEHQQLRLMPLEVPGHPLIAREGARSANQLSQLLAQRLPCSLIAGRLHLLVLLLEADGPKQKLLDCQRKALDRFSPIPKR